MRKYPFTLPAVVLLTAVVYAASLPQTGSAQQPVVVELFTSEGCSSCPPADSMLITLSHKRDTNIAKLILLEEHVEYWNQGGWIDRFSGPTYTERQADYVKDLHLETSYTPQIVIDGHLQASGNNPAAVQEFILQAAKNPKPVTVALHPVASNKLEVSVDGPADKKLQVLFAVTEDDLTTNVRGGENGGKTLTHSAVVRELHRLGSMSDGKFAKAVDLPDKSGWKKEKLRAIVLVQNSNSGEILGAADVPYVPASVQTVGK
jgi:hypothetical protein